MSLRYSTALSHLVLAGTSIYYFFRYYDESTFKLPYGTFLLIIVNSILGVWFWGNPDYGRAVQIPYNVTSALQTICAFPLVTSQILLDGSFLRDIAYIPLWASIFPVVFCITKKSYINLNDFLLIIDTIIVGVVSCVHEKYYGIATAISYAINHFVLREGSLDVEVPNLDLSNYGLCFFCYFLCRGASLL